MLVEILLLVVSRIFAPSLLKVAFKKKTEILQNLF